MNDKTLREARTWTASTGREWTRHFTLGKLMTLRRVHNIDLLADDVYGPAGIMQLLTAVEVCLAEQMQLLGVTIEELGDEIGKDIGGLCRAMHEGLTFFYMALGGKKARAIQEAGMLLYMTPPQDSGKAS